MPREGHKPDCQCVVCRKMREKAARESIAVTPKVAIAVTPPSPPPTEVRLDSLPLAAKFMLGAQECRVGERVESMVVCYNLFINDTMTLGGSTIVKPI